MKCMICDSPSEYYFSKSYASTPFKELMASVGPVDFFRCSSCGFVQSKTHAELSAEEWGRLNSGFHHHIETPENFGSINQPPYAEQAMSLALLGRNGIVDLDSMIDYAAGYGSLSKVLKKYFGIELPIFDRYVNDADSSRYVSEENLGTYKTVLNSAMFEHVICRDDLDSVNRLVDPDGVFIIHTVVCENIPKDPDWFYLDPPVHTAFHTNKSMEILMRQWGYRSSAYSPKSKSWVLFRESVDALEERLSRINHELQSPWFVWKNGFVDYWKGF